LVLVEGKLRSRKWQDKNGQERRSWEIELDNFVLIDKLNKTGNAQPAAHAQDAQPNSSKSKSYDYPANMPDMQAPIPEKDVNDMGYPFDESNDPF
jgi:single-strand DNA-binding protein